MNSSPEKSPAAPIRMTAQEFVTCIAVMAGQAKLNPAKKKSPPRLVPLEEKPLTRPDGKAVWKWVHGKTLDGKAESIKVPVKLIVCTHLPRGKKYPHCS